MACPPTCTSGSRQHARADLYACWPRGCIPRTRAKFGGRGRTNPWPERKVSRVSGVSSVLWAVFGFHPGLQRELSHALCRVLGGASCGFCP